MLPSTPYHLEKNHRRSPGSFPTPWMIMNSYKCLVSSRCLLLYVSPRNERNDMSFPWQGERQDYYIPIINFDTVESGLYRSGFPLARNMPFIRKLGIRTIL